MTLFIIVGEGWRSNYLTVNVRHGELKCYTNSHITYNFLSAIITFKEI